MRKFSVDFTDEQYAKIARIAKKKNRGVSGQLRQIVEEYQEDES